MDASVLSVDGFGSDLTPRANPNALHAQPRISLPVPHFSPATSGFLACYPAVTSLGIKSTSPFFHFVMVK